MECPNKFAEGPFNENALLGGHCISGRFDNNKILKDPFKNVFNNDKGTQTHSIIRCPLPIHNIKLPPRFFYVLYGCTTSMTAKLCADFSSLLE